MPRMDGYELMATIRSQEQYRTLPLIVLTSRAATKHQQRADAAWRRRLYRQAVSG